MAGCPNYLSGNEFANAIQWESWTDSQAFCRLKIKFTLRFIKFQIMTLLFEQIKILLKKFINLLFIKKDIKINQIQFQHFKQDYPRQKLSICQGSDEFIKTAKMQQKYQIQQLQPYKPAHQSQFGYGLVDNSTSMDSSAHNNRIIEEVFNELPLRRSQTKLGNIKIVYENQRFLFTIGPDYICFCIGYAMFILMHITVIYMAAISINNFYLNAVNITFSLTQNISYLIVALSNPGIQTENTVPMDQENSEHITRFCKKCNIRMQKGTHHCRDCDVCIRNYDHHCPWTSKCIGQKNLCKFYFFVTMTMLYIVYCLVMLLVCVANASLQHDRNYRNKPETA